PLGGALAALLLAALSAGLAQPPAGKKYAVLVGVKDYDHAGLRNLDYPVNDVVKLGELLGKHGYQVTLLRSGAAEAGLRRARASTHTRLYQFRPGSATSRPTTPPSRCW